MEALGAVLVGGAGRRMGADKAMVHLHGRPLIGWVSEALAAVAAEVVAVGRGGILQGVPCLPDPAAAHGGPLAGLVTALRHAARRPVIVVGVDQPLVRTDTLSALIDLIDGEDAVAPVSRSTLQVTCAVYQPSLTDPGAAELAAGGSLQSLLDNRVVRRVEEPEWRSWGEDGRSWFSIDTPEQLIEAEQWTSTTAST